VSATETNEVRVMRETIQVVLGVVLEVLGVASVREPSALAFAAAAIAVVAVLALTLALAAPAASATRAQAHPLRAIDVSVQLSQSHPDAAGHRRPRAPGLAASAA
jgi:hypothetical protein